MIDWDVAWTVGKLLTMVVVAGAAVWLVVNGKEGLLLWQRRSKRWT